MKHFIFLTLLLTLVLASCSDTSNLNSFDYNFPEDCCSDRGWSQQFGAYELGVQLYYPNVFTPEANSDNSRYYINANEQLERIASLQVYTQDGELVFENTDFEPNVPSEGWNGSVRGQKLEGAYKVIVKIINADGLK